MKTSRSKSVRALGIVFALIIALTMITLTACNNDVAVESISVVESSVSGYYGVSGFDITTVQLLVTYVDGTTNTISAEKSMLTTEGKNSLTTPGEKNVTINYKGKTAILNVTLVEDEASIVCVTFKDSVGNQLVQKYALVGGSIEAPDAPVVEGQVFIAWVDANGKKVSLNNVTESMTVTASYSVAKTAYTVKFFDHNGNELSSSNVNAGEKVIAKNAPSVSLSKYPEIESYEWSVSFPYTVDTDTVIWMVPTYKSFSVQFAYALEGNVSDQKVISTLGKVVKYNEDVSSSLNSAKKAITDLGYEIVTNPTNSTTITKETTFLFIVRNASVHVTVYGDLNKESKKQDATLNPGTTLNLPNTAAAVTDMRHVGWKIEGSDLFLEIGDTWTVNSDYGREIVFVPVYEKDTIKVNFRFEFAEITLSTDATQKYAVTLSVTEEFALHDAVTYEFIDNLLNNLIDNASDYESLLSGNTVNNASVNKTATDNSSTERNSAFNSVKNSGIASVSATVSGATKFVTVNESVNLNADDLTFTVTLTGATKGLVFTKVEETVEEQTITYYELTDLNSDYVAGTNVYIPDSYKQSGDTESYPVTKISTTDLAGKTIIHVSANLIEIADGAFEGSILYGNLDFGKVTTIGANAFGGANVGSDVKFDVLTSLGAGAFSGIKGQDVSINLGNVITAISANAFANAEGIKEVVIPNTVVEIGNSAFENAEVGGIATLESVTTLGENALKGAILAEINLPVITSLGAGALSDMANLVNVNLGANGKAEDNVTIDVSAFEGSVGIETLTVGVGIVNITDESGILATFEKLNAINVLEGNAKLYSEDGVLYAVVDNAASLVYYPNNKTGNYTLSGVEGYTYSVNASAFDNAVVAVLDLSSVGAVTYNGATTGTVFAVVVASETDVSNAQSAFASASVFVAGADVEFGYDNTNKLIYKTEKRTVNEEEKTVAVVVSGYKYDTSIVVPATLGGYSVVAIEDNAFANYENLTSLKVEAIVEDWSSLILAGCTSLTDLDIAGFVKDENGEVDVVMSDFVGNAWYNAHNIIYIGGTLLGYNNNAVDAQGNAITVVSKEATATYFTDKIPENFFFVDDGSGNNVCNITEIAFADGISEIERSAFEGCAQLQKVDFNKVSTIRRYAFAGCASLEAVVFDGVIMEEGAFSECDSLLSATLTGKLNANKGSRYYLPVMAFNGCDSLEEVNFTYVNAFSSDESGSSYAFYGCSSLEEYDFSKIVMDSIPGKTFGMTGIKYVDFTVMPNVVTVGQMAFENATSLKYVKFGATVKSILDSAFIGVNNLVVEVPYDAPGGLYEDINLVSNTAFEDSALFFISSTVDVTGTFLDGKNVDSSYPTIDFAFSDSMADKGETLGMVAVNNKVFFTESDFIHTELNGYQFVGWYAEASETTKLAFPLVFTDDVTVYAKYYSDKQGSLDSTTDVKYVYYLASAPAVDLAVDEIVKWYVTENGVESLIESWPLVIDAQKDVEYGIVGKIQKSIGGVLTVTDVVELGDVGTQGYAIVNYSDNNANNVSIPDYYDDEINGSKEIIVVFSGAFSNETLLMKEFTLPAYTKAIVMGSGSASDDFSEYNTTTTFNNNLETITIPASVEYIADGVFAGLSNLTDIVFEENSNLVYASVDSFYGSAWYLNALAKARAETNGFIVAGRLAIEFVGTGTVVLVDETEKQVTEDYGFVENTDGINVMYTVYFKDGSVEAGLLENQIAIEVTEGVFEYNFTVGGMDVTLALNTVDSTNWTYTANKNLFIFDLVGATKEVLAINFKSVEDGEVTVPNDVIKLGDEIFKNNQELVTIIVNSNLVEVGEEAFFNSTLSSVKFGATNSEQYSSKVSVIGKDAFNGTPWYRGENVILGTIYLKYNNVSGNTTLTITENVTAIADGAFKNAKLLSTINVAGVKTLVKIGAYAFSGSGITAIELPASVQQIGRGAFENCVSLLSVNMSKANISTLPQDTFKGNVALNAIELANSVTSLGKNSLSGCTALTSITANGITELKVLEGSGEVEFESGLQDTGWYNTIQQKDDVMLTLGSVVVRFILGSETVVDQTTNVLSVSIPEGIVTIAQGAFKEVDTVTEINIPNSVTYIGKYAFENCKDLNTVNFGGNVETVDAYAFSGCTALKNVVLSDAMVTIGDGAFKNTAITTAVVNEQGVKVEDNGLTIPANVTSIGKEAFEGVNTLTVVNIGSKVVSIGDRAFYTSGTLYKVNWELDVNSTLGENDEEIPAPITVLYENTKNYGTSIFASEKGIGSIRFYTTEDNYKFVNSDEFVGKNAWINFGWEFFANGNYPLVEFDKNGYNLSTISSEYILEGDIPTPVHDTMSNGKTYTFMYWYVNDENTPIAYPYSVYGDVTFNARWYENELTESAGEIIGNDGAKHSIEASNGKAIINAIDNAPSTLYIPNTINGNLIVGLTLSNVCEEVTTLVLTNASNFNGLSENIFSVFPNLEKVELQSSDNVSVDFKVVNTPITATYNEKEYTYDFKVVYSDDANGDYGKSLIAFIGNAEKASKELLGEDSETVLDFVFSIPQGVENIYANALSNSALRTVGISNSVKSIGDNAFGKELTTLRVAKNVYITDITYNAIDVNASIMQNDAESTTYSDYTEIKGVKNGYVIGGSTYGYFYVIANALVGYDTSVNVYGMLELPTTVNGIDVTVIASEINVKGEELTADQLGLPTNVRKINGNAFKGIDVLNSIKYDGQNLTDIANDVFGETTYYQGSNDGSLILGKVLVKWQCATNEVAVPEGIVTISYDAFNSSQATSVKLPSTLTTISDRAFYGADKLVSISIPNSVTTIGNDAFHNCDSLTTVTFDTVNSKLVSLGDNAFSSDKKLKNVMLPYSLVKIGDNAFSGCSALTTITFDGYDNVTLEDGSTQDVLNVNCMSKLEELGVGAFLNCVSLTTISIPDGVKEIKDSTFNNCKSLVSVEFDIVNSKLKTIGEQAFAGCIKLGSVLDLTNVEDIELVTVNLPNSLVSVGTEAFMNCSGMWGIQFNYNISEIGDNAFNGCTNLAKVDIYRATAPTIYAGTFVTNGNYRLRIYVNKSSLTNVNNSTISEIIYKYTTKWSTVWANAKNYIYERGTMPTVNYTHPESQEIKTAQADVILTPKANFGNGNVFSFAYERLEQNADRGSEVITRGNAKVVEYGSQKYTDVLTNETYTLLIVDYDVVTLKYVQEA